MSSKWKITIGIVVVIFLLAGLITLGWGERVYRSSGGQRGWSLGALVYQLSGWGQANYLADFNRAKKFPPQPVQREAKRSNNDKSNAPGQGAFRHPAQTPFNGHQVNPKGQFNGNLGYQRFSRVPRFGFFVGGLCCLVFLALLGGLGIFFYRRRRRVAPAATKGTEPTPDVETPHE
jgi:hypothetical protein